MTSTAAAAVSSLDRMLGFISHPATNSNIDLYVSTESKQTQTSKRNSSFISLFAEKCESFPHLMQLWEIKWDYRMKMAEK